MPNASPHIDQALPLAGLYGRLMAHATGLPNSELFAKMIASQALGGGALPLGLGLTPEAFARLLVRHFPHSGPLLELDQAPWPEAVRLEERQDLLDLLLEHLAGKDESETWMAHIVTAACMGGDHLWQDLGLWSRLDLSRLMGDNFPALSAKNIHDMKWKKFLYKQLCQREGVYVCRAPSCEVCADYAKCFGPEE
jgi:nitrogen fixation protein NifQ